MRGSIRQRGDSWEVGVSGGTDPVTGHRVRRYVTAKTEMEAQRELTRLLRRSTPG